MNSFSIHFIRDGCNVGRLFNLKKLREMVAILEKRLNELILNLPNKYHTCEKHRYGPYIRMGLVDVQIV
jgi:hypothetical protein